MVFLPRRLLSVAVLLLSGSAQGAYIASKIDFAYTAPCNSSLEADARQLVHQRRFDVIIKFLYISFYAEHVRNEHLRVPRVALEAYKQHEELWNGCEEGKKNSCGDFLQAFRQLYRSIAQAGFDAQHAIPVCPLTRRPLGSFICDGAHRTTVALLLGRPTPVQCSCNQTCQYKLDGAGKNWDFHFFLRRGLALQYTETAVYHFMRHSRDTYVLHVWPSATVLLHEHAERDGDPLAWVRSAINLLAGHILYFKRVYLNYGAHVMYTHLAYGDASWTRRKAEHTYRVGVPMWVFFVKFPSADAAKQARDIVRRRLVAYTGPEHIKHTLHVTDGVRDELLLARHLLFPHSLHFMNASSTEGKARCHAAAQQLTSIVEPLKQVIVRGITLHEDFFALDSGSVLSFYGIRNSSDFDLVYNHQAHQGSFQAGHDAHHDESGSFPHHKEAIENLLYDPRLHGFCYGVKFLSLPQLIRYKRGREAPRDPRDIQLLSEFLQQWP